MKWITRSHVHVDRDPSAHAVLDGVTAGVMDPGNRPQPWTANLG